MSGIDKLKENAETQKERVDILSATSNKHKITPAKVTNNSEDSANNRVEIDLTSLPKEPAPENIHESLAKDILEGEDSLLGKYIKEKKEEFVERMATFDQEKEMAEEEAAEKEEAEDEGELGFESLASDDTSFDENDMKNVEVISEDISEAEVDIIESSDDEDDEEIVDTVEEPVVDVKVEEAVDTLKSPLDDLVEETPVDVKDAVAEEIKPEENNKKVEDESVSSDFDPDVTEVQVESNESNIVEDDGSENDVDQDEVLDHLKKLATEKLKPVSRNLNISSFTILKKPTANIKGLETETVKAAKWVLPTQGSVVMMKEFLGSELEDLRELSDDASSVSQLYRKFKCIYDHIASPKASTYDAWLKCTPYSDVDHYFFAVFAASFKGSNYLPLDCADNKCKKTFITDDIPLMKMVKFENKEAKAKFTKIYDNEVTTTGKGLYVSEVVPLSNKIAIGFKDASIYSLFEIASLSTQDKDKYSSIIEYIPYIDALYIIDQENQTLTPVGYKIFPENANKTVKSKIRTFFNVLKNLSVDEFSVIRSYVREITSKSEGISYVNPSVSCPYCGKETVEQPMTAEALVFLRSQLSSLVNTSLK